ncbi:MAG: sigma-54-dependent Fis family transcriptional regulator [bacterium]|nr:sigma-54-dependent Fis family transcriptional regulator [bacterium]
MADEPLKQALRAANAELLRRLEELSFVRLVGDALAGEATTAGVARALVELLRAELGVELVALWGVDALEGGVRLAARYGPDDAAPAVPGNGPLVAFAAAGALGRAAAGEPVAPLTGAELPAGAEGTGALALHPLRARGRVLAVLGVGAPDGGDDPERARLVGLVAPVVGLALESAALTERLASENRTLRAELGDRFGRAALIGVSPAFRRLLSAVERLAEADVTVLVLGESGTGKELVARALHWGGRRAEGPFVALNCAALPESLLESELFGIERGVATGVERRVGLVERASGGTLFLDEIGDMTLAVQAKLLRVLQEREVTRVGGGRPIPVDVRVVAATHRDLEAEVRAGRFREDLYFRLKVASLRVPALRERAEDVPLLAQHFLARFAARHDRPGLRLGPDALAALGQRAWAGNVRELENAIEQAVVMAAGPLLDAADLGCETPAASPGAEPEYRAAVRAAVDDTERGLIERALAECGQNRTRAARLLGIGRRTLLYKLKRYRLGPA